MKYIIDRFEHGFAILEDEHGVMTDIPKELMPENAKEGDAVILTEQGEYAADKEQTARRKEEIDELIDDLFV